MKYSCIADLPEIPGAIYLCENCYFLTSDDITPHRLCFVFDVEDGRVEDKKNEV